MNGRATIRRAVTLGIAAILAAALGGCSGAGGGAGDFGSGGSGSAEKGAARLADTIGGQAADLGSSGKAEADSSIAGTAAQKPITLKVELNSTGKDFESTEVYDEITRMTGVTMDIQTYDEQNSRSSSRAGICRTLSRFRTRTSRN